MEYIKATVATNRELSPGNWLLTLTMPKPIAEVMPGQFIMLRCDPADPHSLLRPFSILSIDPDKDTLCVYYKHLGRLSKHLSTITTSTRLDCLYPLGRGFPWQRDWQRVALIGGGVGLAPLLCLARWLQTQDRAVDIHGYFGGATEQDLVPMLLDDYSFPINTSTMDGTAGHTGTVVELFTKHSSSNDALYSAIYTCGPNAMMAALRDVLPDGVPAFASLEEYMACGVGACYGCVAKVRTGDAVSRQRVCCDGPVFPLREVEFD